MSARANDERATSAQATGARADHADGDARAGDAHGGDARAGDAHGGDARAGDAHGDDARARHDGDLPPIEEWWPQLTIGARHRILEDLHAPLEDRVVDEIERLTGRSVARPATLSHHEVGFVEVQQQPVD